MFEDAETLQRRLSQLNETLKNLNAGDLSEITAVKCPSAGVLQVAIVLMKIDGHKEPTWKTFQTESKNVKAFTLRMI